ncbi:hypothetical protein B0H13DRAFT_1675400 [Mycena leptocephala]|nr:hypothetical protein B0H13DRAFT_1675400 [Mycena leptocephala]
MCHWISQYLQYLIDTGTPTAEEIASLTRKSAQNFLRTLPLSRGIPLRLLFSGATNCAVDFLGKLLTFDPRQRLSANDCITHAYLELYVGLLSVSSTYTLTPLSAMPKMNQIVPDPIHRIYSLT